MKEGKLEKPKIENREETDLIKEPDGAEKDLMKINELPSDPKTEPLKVFPWEAAWLKKPDPDNPDDIEVFKRIDAQPAVQKWMVGETMNTEEIKEAFLEKNFYGVCGEKSKGRMEGFVWLYEPEAETAANLSESGLVDSKDTQVLEISFARLVDQNLPVENREKGLITSAIRQICFSLIKKQEKTAIIAFTNPQNLPSEGVLVNAGFIIKGKTFYNKESPEEDNFWILDKNKLETILEKKKSKHVKPSNPAQL